MPSKHLYTRLYPSPLRATEGPGETFLRGPFKEEIFDFFKWRILARLMRIESSDLNHDLKQQ